MDMKWEQCTISKSKGFNLKFADAAYIFTKDWNVMITKNDKEWNKDHHWMTTISLVRTSDKIPPSK